MRKREAQEARLYAPQGVSAAIPLVRALMIVARGLACAATPLQGDRQVTR